jgi:hypothetical protein
VNLKSSNRLNTARLARFVGRDPEVAHLREILEGGNAGLTPDVLPCAVLYVSGPGGVGKTSLLTLWTDVAERSGALVIRQDARHGDPSPGGFCASLLQAVEALDLQPQNDAQTPLSGDLLPHIWRSIQAAANGAKVVLLVDTYERMEPVDEWIRESFLPTLPDNALLVLAGRAPPSAAWRSDAAWGTLIQHVSLRNLNQEHTRRYLAQRSVPESQFDGIVQFTRGHPLALSLIADTLAQRAGGTQNAAGFDPQQVPSVIRTLIEQFVQRVPGPAHRAALEASVLVRVMTEPLLAAMLDLPPDTPTSRETAHELFDWLRGLSFIESNQSGLFPHDLAREALAADVRWRNPEWKRTLQDRARAYYTSRLNESSVSDQQLNLIDYVWLHRDHMALSRFFEWSPGQTLYLDTPKPHEHALILEWVRRHEGEASAAIAAHWLVRQPNAAQVVRDATPEPIGFVMRLNLREVDESDLAADPVTAQCHAWIQKQGGLRGAERSLFFRFWMSGADYQFVCKAQSLIFITAVQVYLSTPKLAFSFFPASNPDFWDVLFGYADIPREPELDYRVGDEPHGIYVHNWRTSPPLMWLDVLARREVGEAAPDEPVALPEQLHALSEADFGVAVRDALRDYMRPDALEANPLMSCRLVVEQTGVQAAAAERVKSLRATITKTIDALDANPRDAKLSRALRVTYVSPAPTQEIAAERIDVPFSTYRRHLQSGVMRVVEMLWARELGGVM